MAGETHSPVKRAPRAAMPRRHEDMRFLAVAAAATAALDRLNQGIALIDKRCQVSFANQLARSICRENDGLNLHGSQLVGTTAPGSLRLSAALKSAIRDADDCALRLERSPGRRPLAIRIAPLRAGSAQSAVEAVLVLIHDCDRYAVPAKEQLCEAYGLTAAEAGVAQLLLRGAAMPEIAAELGISVETVRTHLRRVLGKTGAHRQSELILLLLRDAGGGLYEERRRPRDACHRGASTGTPFG